MSKLPPDEAELFRDAVRDVRQRPANRAAPKKPKPAPRAQFARADEQQVLRESLLPVVDPASLETGDELSFRRDEIAPRVLRKLRSGQYTASDEIDLHGLTASEARVALRTFVANALRKARPAFALSMAKAAVQDRADRCLKTW